jgi:hypothetical protein
MNGRNRLLLAAVAALMILPLFVTGCSDKVVTTPADFKDFSRVDIQNFFDAEITKGSYSIAVTSSEALRDYIEVSKQNDTLVIKLSPKHPFTNFVQMRKMLKVKVAMPAISGVSLSGASHAAVRGFESADTLDAAVSGASVLTLDKIKTGAANLGVSGSSQLKGTLTATDVRFEAEGASRIDIEGAANTLKLTSSGASVLNLERFVHKVANITLSGSSQATIDARETLDFSLSGASRLYFLSNPRTGRVEVAGASTVQHKP